MTLPVIYALSIRIKSRSFREQGFGLETVGCRLVVLGFRIPGLEWTALDPNPEILLAALQGVLQRNARADPRGFGTENRVPCRDPLRAY